MKKRVAPANRKNTNHLEFTPQEPVAIASREYGLMRTSTKTQTPYPHVDPGVDANLLKARLSMRRHFEKNQSEASTPSKEKFDSYHAMKTSKSAAMASVKSVHLGNQLSASQSAYKNALSLGTPHPTKSVALNAKVLSTRLTDLNLQLAEPISPVSEVVPPGTRKKKVRMMSTSTVVMIQPDTTLDSERLSDISLRVTRLDYSVANSHISVSSLSSFAERRRLFDEGEYTITKGRKMSDMMMAYTALDKRVVDHTTQFAKQAKEEIEKYIKAQGLIKTSNDQLKWTRHLEVASPESSSDSLVEPSHTLGPAPHSH